MTFNSNGFSGVILWSQSVEHHTDVGAGQTWQDGC